MPVIPEYSDSGFQIPGATLPGDPNRLKNTFSTQLQGAQDYLKNMKSNSDAIYNAYASQARNSLAQGIKQNRSDFNSRGLLNSGLEKGAEAGTVGGVNQQLGQARSQINQGLNQNLNQLEGGAFNTAGLLAQPGANYAGLQLQGVGTELNANAAQSQMNAGLVGSILGGAGSLAGGYLGGQQAQNQTNQLAALMQQNGGGNGGYSPYGQNFNSLLGNNNYSVLPGSY